MSNDGKLIRPRLKFERDFTMVPNGWVRPGTGISLRAIGLLTQLMSHDPGFSVTFRDLARANEDGDAAIRSAVNELKKAGYLRIEQERYRGKIVGSVWILADPTEARRRRRDDSIEGLEPPDVEEPHVEEPRVGNPHVGNQHAIEVLTQEELATQLSEGDPSTRARVEQSSIERLLIECPRGGGEHDFPSDGGWCGRCGQVRDDGKVQSIGGTVLRQPEAVVTP